MARDQKTSVRATSDIVVQFRRRRRIVIVLGIITLILAGTLTFQISFDVLPWFVPGGTGDILWLYTLSAINFLAFVVLLMVLGRNVLKLMRERASNHAGARFKTQLVLFSISISLLPLIFLFFVSYGLINRSIDKWFSFPALRAVEDSYQVQEQYKARDLDLLYATATIIAQNVKQSDNQWGGTGWFEQLVDSAGKPKPVFMEVMRGDQTISTPPANISNYGADVINALAFAKQEVLEGRSYQKILPGSSNRICLLAGISLDGAGAIIMREIPTDFAAKLEGISAYRKEYSSLSSQGRHIRTNIILQLGLITLVLLFAAMWFALYMARGITEPIDELVKGTDQVAHGNLDYRVRAQAKGELALLISSFNQMASELSTNRHQLEKSTVELQHINLMLEERRSYIETILQSLSTGVISLDTAERLTTINDRAITLLKLGSKPETGTPLNEFLGASNYLSVSRLIRLARRMGTVTREVELEGSDGSTIPTATSVTPLKGADRQYQGTVVMIEDLTELIKAQRSAAWSEVARRMAHEIKNPLTPIQLSAERIARKFKRTTDDLSLNQIEPVITEGTATIIREVDTLKRMVDEFSRFARLPKAKPAPTSLNDVVENAVALYTDRTNGITISERLDPTLPELNLDADQFRQVLVNLIDNALEAISEGSKIGQIIIQTVHDDNEGKARLMVSDTGHGVPHSDRDKLFLPYFSTKRRDTGLGLAIVNHIVTEHGGRIFVEDNLPKGARFVVELPA